VNAVELRRGNKFASTQAGSPGDWIQYDFRTMKAAVSGYTVRSQWDLGPAYAHAKNWVIEISNDGHSWSEIDRQADNSGKLNSRIEECITRS
jgi:hypothetical protein